MHFYANHGRELTRRRLLQGLLSAVALPLAGSPEAFAAECPAPASFPNSHLLAAMQRGVNLPGWDLPDATRRPRIEQLEALKANAFTHIRLPVDNRRLEGPGDYVTNLYDQVITLLSLGYVVSIDLHPDGKIGRLFETDPSRGEAYLQDLWARMLPMIGTLDPTKVAVELLNEPQIEQHVWMPVANRLIARIRRTLPNHTIVVGPSGPQRHEMLLGMEPFADPNIVYAIHYYDPFLFSHQGANWGPPGDPLRDLSGLPFPATKSSPEVRKLVRDLTERKKTVALKAIETSLQTDWTEAMIAEAFDVMAGWSAKHGRPVIINEFGILSFTAPRQSRLRWLQTVNRLAGERCLGWTHWDFQDGFGLINDKTGMPDADIMRALARIN